MDWTAHYAKLFRDYLAYDPETSGISASLVKKSETDTAKVKRPRLVVTCDARESNHRAMFVGTVRIAYHIQTKENGSGPAAASELVDVIDTWLRNDAKWAQFIQAKPVADRTGWLIQHKFIRPLEVEDDEEAHTRDFIIPVDIRAIAKL